MGSGFDDVTVGEVSIEGAAAPGVKKVTKRRRTTEDEGTKPGFSPPAESDAAIDQVPTREASDKLKSTMVQARVDELKAADEKRRAEVRQVGEGLQFETVQRRKSAKQDLRPDFQRIVETVWVEDMEAAWAKIKAALRMGRRRSEHAYVTRSLDDCQQHAFEAASLYATAKREKERWEAENDVTHSAMWNEANRVLQAEKDTGMRAKQITDADTRAMAATLFPDEWRAQAVKRKEVELTVSLIGDLAELTKKRANDLNTIRATMRG